MARLIQDNFIAPPCSAEIDCLYEDESLLVIHKPTGLLTLSGKNPLNSDSVHARLIQKWPSAKMIHRLDFGTSGLLVIALTKHATNLLNQQFQTKSIEKTYEALLFGNVDDERGIIDAAIARDDANFPKMKIHALGKAAQTKFQVIHRYESPNQTRIRYWPLTGRTHQLRIHSAHIGHPISGCDIYGHAEAQAQSQRLCLHASNLSFAHPITEETLNFQSPCPF